VKGTKVHVGSSVLGGMDGWTPLEIEEASEAPGLDQSLTTDGLGVDAATLQASFDAETTHLDEVRQRHEAVLVTAGMIPEHALAATHPERALTWVVQGLNGRVHPDGLSIPLLGSALEQVNLTASTDGETATVRLTIREEGHEPLVRDMNLPEGALERLTATWVNGHLHLRW
jgi:hypothetical protein